MFADVHTATSSVRGAALASTCTGSTPQAHAARTCHAKEGGVGVLRHCYGVEAACCVVVAAHASADGRDATSVLRARVPRVGEDEEAPCDGARVLDGSEAGGVPAAARQPPGAVLALERHGVAELRVGAAAAAACQMGDAGAFAAPGWSQGP